MDRATELAITHYKSLTHYLASYLQSIQKTNSSNQRASAREKLTRLTKQQFSELSTDVYDEMNRRLVNSDDMPFLPVRDEFHPKRNQARQKLATLPTSRFKDLASDVFYEIERRFPEVKEMFPTEFSNTKTASMSQEVMRSERYSQRQSQTQRTSTRKSTTDRVSSPNTSVNFGSLDHLMADLGNMITHPNKGAEDMAQEALDKLRAEYNETIKQLETKIKNLEEENRVRKKQNFELDEQLKQQLQINDELEQNIDNVSREYKKLKEDFDSLQEDYTSQQQIANDIKSEATNLLDEIKSLSRKNDELVAENQKLKQNVSSKAQDAGPRMSAAVNPVAPTIDEDRIAAYQAAVDELLRASKSDQHTSVLVAMKSVVLTCKNMTEDAEAYESTAEHLTDQDLDHLGGVKGKLSAALTHLMGVAKNHATSYGNIPAGALESAASALSAVIVELVELMKQLESGEEVVNNKDQGHTVYDIEQLKGFLEKQTDLIVQAIQTLLYAMRQSSTFGEDFKETISGITSIVDNLVSVSRETLCSPDAEAFRQQGETILQELSNSNVKLEELGNNMINSPQSKALKQRLATSSYEIAKYVKELISLIE